MDSKSPHQETNPPDPPRVWNRQQAALTVPAFPYGAGAYLHGPTLFNPFGPHQFPPLPLPGLPQPQLYNSEPGTQLPQHRQIPFIIDPSSFQMAANQDPKNLFESFQGLAKERDNLKAENIELAAANKELKAANKKLKTENDKLKAARNGLEVQNKALHAQNKALDIEVKEANELYEHARWDHRLACNMNVTYEGIVGIQSAKQVILWKYIWRLKNGETGPHPNEDEYWLRFTNYPRRNHPMAPVSEASEPASEQSDASSAGSKDSSETKLDPHAQTFVPQSPIKSVQEPEPSTPYTPTKSSVGPRHATVEDCDEDEETTPTNLSDVFIDPKFEPTDELEDFKEVIVKLPANFFGVCPNSLSTPGPCPLIHCRLQALCEDFNDENGSGCNNRSCLGAHIYRSCTEELDGVGCSYMQIPETSSKRNAHFVKRAHPHGDCSTTKKEWQMRVAISELRDAHKAQRY